MVLLLTLTGAIVITETMGEGVEGVEVEVTTVEAIRAIRRIVSFIILFPCLFNNLSGNKKNRALTR